mgnify:CR=1 FL=1|jgi:hypothetical protein
MREGIVMPLRRAQMKGAREGFVDGCIARHFNEKPVETPNDTAYLEEAVEAAAAAGYERNWDTWREYVNAYQAHYHAGLTDSPDITRTRPRRRASNEKR